MTVVVDGLHVGELAGDNEAIVADHGAACSNDSFLAIGREGNVGASSVAAVEGPFGFAVADDEEARRGHRKTRSWWREEGRKTMVMVIDYDGGNWWW